MTVVQMTLVSIVIACPVMLVRALVVFHLSSFVSVTEPILVGVHFMTRMVEKMITANRVAAILTVAITATVAWGVYVSGLVARLTLVLPIMR